MKNRLSLSGTAVRVLRLKCAGEKDKLFFPEDWASSTTQLKRILAAQCSVAQCDFLSSQKTLCFLLNGIHTYRLFSP